MIAKYWKKIGLIIVIIACLFNVVSKLVSKLSFSDELKSTVDYIQTVQKKENNTLKQ